LSSIGAIAGTVVFDMEGNSTVRRFDLIGAEDRATARVGLWGLSVDRLGTIRARWKPLAMVAAVLALVAAGWWWTAQRPAAVRYLTMPATRGAVERAVNATGTVNPMLTIIIGSYVSGVISTVSCDYNTRVRKGQLCAKIDPRPYQAALDQARGQLARDTGQLEGARVDLARYKVLEAEDSIAKQTYDDQVALVHQLEGSVQLDRAAVESATTNLGYTNIVSPVDGTVVARNITIGQTVAASFQTPTLFLIATDLTKMEVDTNVSESDIGSIKEGDGARFTVEAFPERTFNGAVSQVRQAPQTVQNVVTYDVVVAVDNPDFVLKPGMTATVAVVTARRENVLRVPDQALRFTPGGPGSAQQPALAQTGGPSAGTAPPMSLAPSRAAGKVWVVRAGKPVPLEVRTGLDDDTYTEVLAGDLRVGDRLIVGEQRAGSTPRSGTFRFGL
jgi:HlyD family secretion protein